MARRVKLEFEKKQRLPEPRRTKKDDFEELTKDELAESYDRDPMRDARAILKGPSVKGFGGLRRTAEPYEKQKEEAEAEKSLKQPEYGVKKLTKKRYTKRS